MPFLKKNGLKKPLKKKGKAPFIKKKVTLKNCEKKNAKLIYAGLDSIHRFCSSPTELLFRHLFSYIGKSKKKTPRKNT
jgi:hypothetical protein